MARCCVIKDSTGDVIVRCDAGSDGLKAQEAAQAGAAEALARLPHSPPVTTHVVTIASVGAAVNYATL